MTTLVKKSRTKIVNSNLYKEQNNKSSVNVLKIEPSKEILDIYRDKFIIPFEIEHLLPTEIWNIAIAQKYVEARSNSELVRSYQGEVPRNKSIDVLMEEKIKNVDILETIVNFNPHSYKKMEFCQIVEKLKGKEGYEDLFGGFSKTIEKIELFFNNVK